MSSEREGARQSSYTDDRMEKDTEYLINEDQSAIKDPE